MFVDCVAGDKPTSSAEGGASGHFYRDSGMQATNPRAALKAVRVDIFNKNSYMKKGKNYYVKLYKLFT